VAQYRLWRDSFEGCSLVKLIGVAWLSEGAGDVAQGAAW
jgi:hypothetical protein